ncbi:MAG: DNA-directed RNA polymerase subunit beta' [Pelagibacterales bacterium]|nr:DNA-directed RNA polymerase subunit beta' [Pelagibacterales bacterium]MBL6861817.1 DNA-directed RNA polymerase subunit beta' [Pelagibacterales bacterium]
MSQSIMNIFNPAASRSDFNQVRISIASPERILSWSYGEIKKPETINYRTFKPERDGLFCSRIFGPIKDYECLCGKYKRMKFKGIICEKCGVEVTKKDVRRERMGHIKLAAPVAHIWFLKSLPSRIALMVDMKLKDLEKVLYFEQFMVTEPGLTSLEQNQLLDENELEKAKEEWGEDAFTAGIGAEAVRKVLEKIELEEVAAQLRTKLENTKAVALSEKLLKRIKLYEAFISSGNRPEWMILTVIPVIPPELRPLVPLDGGRFASSDLNDLYRRVINRNNRLARLIELRAPDIIIRNEKRMLQESVDALFDNGRRGRVITGTNKRPLKSLAEMLKGKQGRFRQNLLGKRVDYSGRSVIVVGPELKLHQCGLPKKMALELFKPFIYARLESLGLATTLKQAKKLVENERPEVWDVLDRVIREHPIILNRAPTLHRLGVQAFEPLLIDGKAIQLHPLVCTAFNADFDGDQMAVHVPLSLEAQLEARVLMMSTNNILNPANGKPVIVPSQDIVLGIYYLTQEKNNEPGEGSIFKDINEIEQALENKAITLHSKITSRITITNDDGIEEIKRMDSTAGRFIMWNLLPKNKDLKFSLVNRILAKKEMSELIDVVYRYCGQKDTVLFADAIKELGFYHAYKAGISFGKDDMIIPDSKEGLINETSEQIEKFEKQYNDGLITSREKYNKVIDTWAKCTDRVAQEMMNEISSVKVDPITKRELPINSIYMMANSGARGSAAQMKQLAGMRGLMAKPSGDIIETPIISNFKEGLNVLEYFNSTHGARKGLADTALKTANSGYLTRRLCDVAQDASITIEDCNTNIGVRVSDVVEGGEVIVSISERVLGRFAQEDIKHPITEELIVAKGNYIEEVIADQIEESGIQNVYIRSALTCESKRGLCVKCYGRDLARGFLVNLGETVGMIAAQSIGEPGTQLTMRTFHIGGTAQINDQSFVEVNCEGIFKILNKNTVEDSKGDLIVMGRNCQLAIQDKSGKELANYKVPYGTRILVKEDSNVSHGTKICEWDPFTNPVISEKTGTANYVDLQSGISLTDETDEKTGLTNMKVKDWKANPKGVDLKPRITLRDKSGEVIMLANGTEARYFLPPESLLSIADGAEVHAGDILARTPQAASKTKDITGGLPRVAELFEARKPKDFAVIAENSGYISFGKDMRGKQKVIVTPEDEHEEPKEYLIPKGKQVAYQEGEKIEKGDYLLDGNPDPHDILEILGIEPLANYLINEVQEVYRLQGVQINDKHIEVLCRQMLKKVKVVSSGDSSFIANEEIERVDYLTENEELASQGKELAVAKPILLGITKASLSTKSFISAASFQETTRILTDAAIKGKVDTLQGLKENVIVGRLIPAGTGRVFKQLEKRAKNLDNTAKEEMAAMRAKRELETAEIQQNIE